MGRAEDVVRAREAQQYRESQERSLEIKAAAMVEIRQLVPQFLQLMDTLSYPDSDTFIEWQGEEFLAWKLFDHAAEGDIHGERLYLLSTGTILEHYQSLSEYVEFDVTQELDPTYHHSINLFYNAQILTRRVEQYTAQLNDPKLDK